MTEFTLDDLRTATGLSKSRLEECVNGEEGFVAKGFVQVVGRRWLRSKSGPVHLVLYQATPLGLATSKALAHLDDREAA